jgi:hypothetical protein
VTKRASKTLIRGTSKVSNFAGIVALGVEDRRDQEIEGLGPDPDERLVGQVLRVGEDPALKRRVLVEDVDAGADQIVSLEFGGILELRQRGKRRLVGVDDLEVLQIGSPRRASFLDPDAQDRITNDSPKSITFRNGTEALWRVSSCAITNAIGGLVLSFHQAELERLPL